MKTNDILKFVGLLSSILLTGYAMRSCVKRWVRGPKSKYPEQEQPYSEGFNMENDRLRAVLINLSETEAMAKATAEGMRPVVQHRNGEDFFLPSMIDSSRVRLTVVGDKVTGVDFG